MKLSRGIQIMQPEITMDQIHNLGITFRSKTQDGYTEIELLNRVQDRDNSVKKAAKITAARDFFISKGYKV